MNASEQRRLEWLCDHIAACADLWDKSGVSRVRAITEAAAEIREIAQSLASRKVSP